MPEEFGTPAPEQLWKPLQDFVLKQQAALDAVKHIKGDEKTLEALLSSPIESLSFYEFTDKIYEHLRLATESFAEDRDVDSVCRHLVHLANYAWMAEYKVRAFPEYPVV
jgi:hypothetical protein